MNCGESWPSHGSNEHHCPPNKNSTLRREIDQLNKQMADIKIDMNNITKLVQDMFYHPDMNNAKRLKNDFEARIAQLNDPPN